jgi:hypothetical protein
MSDTTFIPGTVVASSWLNDVNTSTYAMITVTGTNALLGVAPSTYTAYTTGSRFFFQPPNFNTTAVTININGLGVKNITKYGNTALILNDIQSPAVAEIIYDGTRFQLVNPQSANTIYTGRLLAVQTFTSSGTYTPTLRSTRCLVKAVSGGGGGGGIPPTAAGQVSVGAGGGAGGYVEMFIQGAIATAVTVGGIGPGGNVSGAGGSGGTTALAGYFSITGGSGGGVGTAGATAFSGAGAGGAPTGGTILNLTGASGNHAIASFSASIVQGGIGGSSYFSGGASGAIAGGGASAGNGATGFGAGGGGASAIGATGGAIGGSGSPGIVIIYDYS